MWRSKTKTQAREEGGGVRGQGSGVGEFRTSFRLHKGSGIVEGGEGAREILRGGEYEYT